MFFKRQLVFTSQHIVADIGAGTGISAQLFLKNGNKVFAVEPNKEMRDASVKLLSKYEHFLSINGTAENTTLRDHSIDIVFAAQAFHWFNRLLTRIEFERIMKPGGHIVLVWNVRKEEDAFQKGYEKMLQSLDDYNLVNHKNVSAEEMKTFFAPHSFKKVVLENSQVFNLEGLKGRLMSSSYFPKEGTEHERLIEQTEELFNQHEKNGVIHFLYDTSIYVC